MHLHKLHFLLFVVALLLSACSGHHKPKTLNHQSQTDAIDYINSIQPSVIHKNKEMTFDAFIADIKNNRAIFVGEKHDRYDNHLNQLAILKHLHQENPNIAIGVEWFQQPYQWVLNHYLNGFLDEKKLLEKSEYYKRWGYPYNMFKPIIAYAKQHDIPIIALNAPVELTRKIGKSGVNSLTPQERAKLPKVIHPPEKNYRSKLENIFKQHSHDKKRLENFITVQRVWDETMAMNTAKFLNEHPKHKIVVFAGNGHISNGVGIPHDLKRQINNINTVTISSGTLQEKEQASNVDYFVINEAVNLPKSGKMGIMLKNRNGHIIIDRVFKDSAAEKAGLKQGDHLYIINGKTIRNLTDFKLLLNSKHPNDAVELQIFRENNQPQLLLKRLVLQ